MYSISLLSCLIPSDHHQKSLHFLVLAPYTDYRHHQLQESIDSSSSISVMVNHLRKAKLAIPLDVKRSPPFNFSAISVPAMRPKVMLRKHDVAGGYSL